MQRLSEIRTVLEVEDETFEVPDNVWCFDQETKCLVLSRTLQRGRKVVLVPKVAGG